MMSRTEPGSRARVDRLQEDRALTDRALREARIAAFGSGEFIDQESFVRAGEVLDLARHAGIGAGTSVLDLCCGIAGPGRLIAREFGCRYLGVDASAAALAVARERAAGLDCRFLRARIPPVPAGRFDVVVLIETVLAFRDKERLLAGIADVLPAGGRFACTLEAGAPLTEAERAAMPASETVWPIPLDEFDTLLRRCGFRLRWQRDHTAAHRATVDALVAAFTARRVAIAAVTGERAIDELLAGHRLWSRWLGSGRIHKVALVACRC